MRKRIRTVLLFLSLFASPAVALAACIAQSITFGETRNGSLSNDDCIDHNANGEDYYYDIYEFDGTIGQEIAITNSSASIDPDLLLLFPDDTNMYDDDSGGALNARIPASGFLTLNQTGRFLIFASSGWRSRPAPTR
ncbi:MAG: hypothetical protein IPI73_18675 [Betaproteobacteria bacterium]|nr:hypothetical protein [Betaproteobacteria bacterium]